jgi:hypothetical protein
MIIGSVPVPCHDTPRHIPIAGRPKRLSLPSTSPVSARTALAGTGRPGNELLMLTSTA